MQISVVTLFPQMVTTVTEYGVLQRARKAGLLNLSTVDPREFAQDLHRTVDDRPYGGGPGMVMKVEPLRSAIHAARAQVQAGSRCVYLGPAGRRLDQPLAQELAQGPGLVLVAGRYEGVDERLLSREFDEELSIGDYVLSGGELAAMVVVDTVARMVPGVLGDERSNQQDSFSDGLLDHPHYTRPEQIDGMGVPPVLLGGNHAQIERWRLKQALGRTWDRRPELIQARGLSDKEQRLLDEYISESSAE